MAERHGNDTLEQQRRARQEFLELKKMQNGEMDTGPKPSEVAIVPHTPTEKIKNIWFHDKWLILGGLALVIVLTVMISQCASRINYDLEVVVFAYSPVADTQVKAASAYLEQFCEDINDDGEVHIQVINCSYSKDGTDKQYQYSMSTKLQAVLAADANALLFITDSDSYTYLNGLSGENKLFEGDPLPLDGDFYTACTGEEDLIKLPEGLQISCRAVTDMTISKDKKIKKYYEQSQNIIKGLSQD